MASSMHLTGHGFTPALRSYASILEDPPRGAPVVQNVGGRHLEHHLQGPRGLSNYDPLALELEAQRRENLFLKATVDHLHATILGKLQNKCRSVPLQSNGVPAEMQGDVSAAAGERRGSEPVADEATAAAAKRQRSAHGGSSMCEHQRQRSTCSLACSCANGGALVSQTAPVKALCDVTGEHRGVSRTQLDPHDIPRNQTKIFYC